MKLNEYQSRAIKSDLNPGTGPESATAEGMLIPLLGLAGEAGHIASEYKKYLRSGRATGEAAYMTTLMKEELGDVMWYVATLANRYGLSLETIASFNLKKNGARWTPLSVNDEQAFLDDRFQPSARLPRTFTVQFTYLKGKMVVRDDKGRQFGDGLTDNNYFDDGYRFHDVMHFSFSAVLGWSPVTRKLFGRKRPSISHGKPFDENTEDGGRAKVLDEAIVALCYSYWKSKNLSPSIKSIDYDLLRSIKQLTEHMEVSACGLREWNHAILKGFQVWNSLRKNDGGWVTGDMYSRDISYAGPPTMRVNKRNLSKSR